MPPRRDVTIRCTCPDDEGGSGVACKHAVATLFAFADEVSLDLDALARWRQSDTFDDGESGDGDRDDRLTNDIGGDRRLPRPPVDPLVAELTALLEPPAGQRLPEPRELTAPETAGIPDRLVADVLDDAIAHLRVRWD